MVDTNPFQVIALGGVPRTFTVVPPQLAVDCRIRYILVCLACLAATPASAENWFRGDSR